MDKLFYIELIPNDPFNDVKGVFSSEMINDAFDEIKVLESVIEDFKQAKSTKEKLETMKKLSKVEFFTADIIIKHIKENLKRLSK